MKGYLLSLSLLPALNFFPDSQQNGEAIEKTPIPIIRWARTFIEN
jgi:hypothetical protein